MGEVWFPLGALTLQTTYKPPQQPDLRVSILIQQLVYELARATGGRGEVGT